MSTETQPTAARPEGSDVVIRPARGEDLTGAVELGSRVFRQTYTPIAGAEYVELGLAKWWTPTAVSDEIRAGRMVVAELEGRVVGILHWGREKSRSVIWKAYVLPDLQGAGIGTAMIDEVCRQLREVGRDEVYISYSFGNERTRRWLEGLGFVEQWRDEGNDVVPTQVWTRKILVPSARQAASYPDS